MSNDIAIGDFCCCCFVFVLDSNAELECDRTRATVRTVERASDAIKSDAKFKHHRLDNDDNGPSIDVRNASLSHTQAHSSEIFDCFLFHLTGG